MPTLHQQILERFADCDADVRDVIKKVIEFEIENIHWTDNPRYKAPILAILDRVVRNPTKEQSDET